MRDTVLQLVQGILSAMDSDEVNSISDTIESMQVANLLKYVYYDLATDLGLQEHEGLIQLVASGDDTKPVLMSLPDNVSRLYWVKYNYELSTETQPLYLDLEFVPFLEFINRQQGLRNNESDIGIQSFTMNGGDFEYTYRNDKMPEYYTTINNTQVLFDSYNVSQETTLQSSNSMAGCLAYPDFTLDDAFVPVLDPTQFSYFRNKAKTRAFNELKQTVNQESAAETRTQKIAIQRNRHRIDDTPAIFKIQSRFGRKN